MSNILIITPNYPTPAAEDKPTKVVHYFAKEWQKIGENIRVISVPSYFFKIFYYYPKFVERFFSNRFGGAILTRTPNNKCQIFNVENVKVFSVPVFKCFPGAKVSKRHICKRIKKILEYLHAENFMPDIIVGHWGMPSLPFLFLLKKHYGCPTVLVTHSNHIQHYKECMRDVDLWGYRSISAIEGFKKYHPDINLAFRCLSGVPSSFLFNPPVRDFSKANRYIYIGALIDRKHPDKVIDAVTNIHSNMTSYSLSFIGDGILRQKLKFKTQNLGAESNIHFLGQIERSKIIEQLDNSDIFIMISSSEVFGLVYIEAMARGCIVIASKGEGMDGIIVDGYNGFLVNSGDSLQLAEVISIIHDLTPQERKNISKHAIETASNLTEEKVAKQYLNEIINVIR